MIYYLSLFIHDICRSFIYGIKKNYDIIEHEIT